MRANCRNSDRIRRRAGLTALAAAILAVSSAGGAHADDTMGELVSSTAQAAGWGGFDRVSVLEYVTEGPTGAATTATGLLLTSNGAPPPGGWPVIAWDHGTSGLARSAGSPP
ncbi:hypothetical protein ACIHDR_18820 [Nocardia sp. NPDC052278]|uniref:hypothetical protein n=1 Tax=unclassified Nocardia TaxID=2637762 RepID=UPI0036835DFB